MNEPSGTYQDEKAFRRAVEKQAKASVSDPDWSDLLQDRHESFDAADFTEMLNAVRELSAQKSKSSPEGKARGYRLAHVQRAAEEATEMVESFRLDLFGHTHPPFSNRAVEAADWIESKVQEPQTQRLVIEVTTPANVNLMESIIWCSDYLSRQTESCTPITDYDGAVVARFIETGENIRSIGFKVVLLEYLGVNAEGEINIKRIAATTGDNADTIAGRLLDKLGHLPPPTSPVSSGPPAGADPYPYEETPGGLIWNKETTEGIVPIPLTTFTAVITGQAVEDDGVETRRFLEIEATLRQRNYRFQVAAGQFATMNWPMEHLGAAAALWPGFGIKDQARAAIQFLSGDPPERKVYAHLGWREIGGTWYYLHAGGAGVWLNVV